MPSQSEVVIATGGVAQQLLPVRLGRSRLIINPLNEDCWVYVNGTAAVDVGEIVYQNSPAQFSVEKFPEVGGAWSVFSATTGSKIVIREA